VAFKPVAGFQIYEVSPLAFNVSLLPEQRFEELGVTANIGVGVTVTTTVFVPEHVPVEPLTV